MTKADLQRELGAKHQAFTDYIASLNDADFTYSPDGQKWTAGQQLDHIRLSVSPLVMAFGLPKFIPGLLFGRAKTSVGYEEVVANYQRILAEGGKAGKEYIPKPIPADAKKALTAQTNHTVAQVLQRLNKYTETDLDRLRLPHPLIGKMSFREMLHFALYHVQHHHAQALKNLENR